MHCEILPEASVAVKVTLFVPRSAQVKLETSMPKAGVPQLSVEPPSISEATIEALPAPSKNTVIF